MMQIGQGISAVLVIGAGLFGLMVDTNNSTHFAFAYLVFGILTAWACGVVMHLTPKQWGLLNYWVREW